MTGMAGRTITEAEADPKSSSRTPLYLNQTLKKPPDSGGLFVFPFSGLCRGYPVTLLDIRGSLC
jgi:hypothetical protein